jgi:hypothetical protein
VPITNCGPSAVAFILSFIYKEIKGRKNVMILIIATVFAIVGSVLCGISK